ncbi:MAG TPA: FtsX-like permease family protein [Devosiaceae bacterium]|nr:FtsX-like permease family protein [Devosiaceae bacterium]
MSQLQNWIRIALLDLRGDLRRFGVLLACLALGTCTIAAVGSVGASLQDAIIRDATKLMGGDLEASRSDRRATPEERAFLETLGPTAEVDDSNGRAVSGENSAFLDIVAVDGDYPLVGNVHSPQLPNGEKPWALLGNKNGMWGAIVNPIILDRLGIKLGGTFKIGDTPYQARGVLGSLPDGAARGFHLGLTTLISVDALAATPDARPPLPGMLTQYRYKIVLPMKGQDALAAYAAGAKAIADKFHDPEWATRSPKDAAGDLARYYDVFTQFLLIVGLSALLVGGVGVSNAVSAYVTQKQRSIATMRSLGATGNRIMVHFLVQLGILSLIGIAIGVTLGALATAAALPTLGRILGVDLPPEIHFVALATAVGFGLLVAFGFSFMPLLRAQKLKPAMLFRSVGGAMEKLGWHELLRPQAFLPLVGAAVLIYLLALLTTRDLTLVNWYAIGVIAAFLLLRFAGLALQFLLRLLPPVSNAAVRNAIKAVYRPGSPAPVVILSLGLGLAMLLLIVLIDNNTRNQLQGEVARDAPTFLATDLFPDEVDDLNKLARTDKDFAKFVAVPSFSGNVTAVNGVPVGQIKGVSEEAQFMLGGATRKPVPITWAGDLPPESSVADGQWWGKDYKGPPLISLRTSTAAALNLKVGDKVDFDLYNQHITATLANTRNFQWQSGMNFMVTFSPHALDGLPGNFMGGVYAAPGASTPVGRKLAQQFPDVTFIPVGDALNQAATIIDQLSTAVDIVGGLAVINGLLVLAGTMAAGRAQREADAVVQKVLGATRGDVIRAFVLEYGILGAFAAVLAAVLGVIGAWAITVYALQVGYGVDLPLILVVIVLTVALTIATGAATTWGALSTKPAQYLRTE